MYGALPTDQRQAVEQGRLVEGMERDAVYLAWGRPAGVKEGSSGGRQVEKWRYVNYRPMVTNHFNMGYGYGYGRGCDYGYYDFGPTVDYIPYTAAVVEFRDGKVTGWEQER